MTNAVQNVNLGAMPAVFDGIAGADELGSGISSSLAVVSYRGKVWRIKFGGEEHTLMRPDGDGPRNSIDVVIPRASSVLSKIFYKNGYVEGSAAPPDCWSSNGVTPDMQVEKKVATSCVACPMNAWGSRPSQTSSKGKACGDSKRLAIVPLEDIENEAFGGPMLLRVPGASLKNLLAYSQWLKGQNAPVYAVVTSISFDPNEAYPKLVFTPKRFLTNDEAQRILHVRDDERTHRIINEEVDTPPVIDHASAGFTLQGEKPAVVVEAEKFITPEMDKPKAAAPKAAPKATPKVIEPEVINPDDGIAPGSFEADLEAELDALLKPKAA